MINSSDGDLLTALAVSKHSGTFGQEKLVSFEIKVPPLYLLTFRYQNEKEVDQLLLSSYKFRYYLKLSVSVNVRLAGIYLDKCHLYKY